MSDSHLSGPLNVTDALIVGGTIHATGGINLAGGGTVTGDQSIIGNFNVVGTAGVHGAVTVHSLVNEGALTALGTTGLAAVDMSGALNVIGTAGVHNTLTAHTLVSDGNVTATGGTLTVGSNKLVFGTNTPAAGAWIVGDIVFNNSATAASGGTAGWICTSAGSQGTWKAFGTIYA